MTNRIKKLWTRLAGTWQKKSKPFIASTAEFTRKTATTLKRKLPKKLREKKLSLKEIDIRKISENQKTIRWLLTVITLYLAAQMTGKLIGLFLPSDPGKIPSAPPTTTLKPKPKIDVQPILTRNMFNVQGDIPAPFDQGQLDCMSQAKPSTSRITLLATIVMSNEDFSTALLSGDPSGQQIAVKKDDYFFDGRYQALKIERRKMCFKVLASQEFEFVEIPDEIQDISIVPSTSTDRAGGNISVGPDNSFTVRRGFLESKLNNLNEILRTAKANPYIKNGQFEGFIIQSIEDDSLFKELGIEVGDILRGVNDIDLDNYGKGLEAFQRLRSASQIKLKVMRNGQEQILNYEVN